MTTLRQSLTANLTRRYPFYSGCIKFANHPLVKMMAGISTDQVWTSIPGGKALASLDELNIQADLAPDAPETATDNFSIRFFCGFKATSLFSPLKY
ncbi:MAG: hypothetical protein F6K61_04715 [Sphaerospermopsis sp. SIO1G1]|nr:hypothetical protein [Sphaerospermopsis sp. SIO1G1]